MGYGSEILAKQLNLGQTFVQFKDGIWIRHGLVEQSNCGNFWPFVFQNLSMGERAILLSFEFYVWYAEGGFDSFFFEGDNYKRAYETVQALQKIGMNVAAQYLERAIEVVRIPNPVPDNFEYESSEPANPALEELEGEYRKVRRSEMFEEKCINYLRQHPEEFV